MVAYVDEFRDRFRAGIGRGRVTDVMREPGIRGVRRGGTPVPPDRRGARAAGPASWNAGSRRGAEPATPVLGLQDTGTDRTGYYANQAAQAAPL